MCITKIYRVFIHKIYISTLVVFALGGILPQEASSQTPEQYRELCGKDGGLDQLRLAMDPSGVSDLELQAEGLGIDPKTHIRERLVQLCAYFAPGSVVVQSQEQSWSFPMSDLFITQPGSYGHREPARCYPYCSESVVVKLNSELQICNFNYQINYESVGPWRGTPSGARLHFTPTLWMSDEPGAGFRGITISAQSWRESFIEFSNFEIEVVWAALTADQRRARGCLVPDRNYAQRVGRSECSEDHNPSSNRNREECEYVHRHIGDRTSIRKFTMRKVLISKPPGNTGIDIIRVYDRGSIAHEYRLLPGQSRELLSKSGSNDNDFTVEVITKELGEGGQSRFGLSTEWFRP